MSGHYIDGGGNIPMKVYRGHAGEASIVEFAAHMARLLYNDATLDDCTEEQKRAWLNAAKALMKIYDIRNRAKDSHPRS